MLFSSPIESRLSLQTALAGAMVMCAATLGGCANDAQSGALIGGLLGTGAGAIIGHQTGEKWAGAGIGAAAGAATGYIIGNEMDKDPRRSHNSHPRYEY
jgi:uncharacterized protein YcfJ